MNQNQSTSPAGGQGYLIVRASTALGAIPVAGATVSIRKDLSGTLSPERGDVIRITTTDRDGRTERIELDAPPRSQSMQPGGAFPYATYNIDVEAPGYYRLFFNNVPIYDSITSIQPAMLIPIAQSGNLDGISPDDIYYDENVNPALREAKDGESL